MPSISTRKRISPLNSEVTVAEAVSRTIVVNYNVTNPIDLLTFAIQNSSCEDKLVIAYQMRLPHIMYGGRSPDAFAQEKNTIRAEIIPKIEQVVAQAMDTANKKVSSVRVEVGFGCAPGHHVVKVSKMVGAHTIYIEQDKNHFILDNAPQNVEVHQVL